MLQTMQTLEMETFENNGASPSKQKLQLVKLVIIVITLGFTLTLTVLVSDEKRMLLSLNKSFSRNDPILLESKQCKIKERFSLTSDVYAIECKIRSLSYVELRRFKNEKQTAEGKLINLKQWQHLKMT